MWVFYMWWKRKMYVGMGVGNRVDWYIGGEVFSGYHGGVELEVGFEVDEISISKDIKY